MLDFELTPRSDDFVGDAIRDIQKVSKSVQGKPLCMRFSGGKDSVVVKWLFDQAKVPYIGRFSPTTVDPPEVLDFINKEHSDVVWDPIRTSMFKLIIKKGFPPTPRCRYCCREFKERNSCGAGTWTCTGVRKEESKKRSSRQKFENCTVYHGVVFFHPIIDWTQEQVWQIIRDNYIRYCLLYDEGFDRIGCIGCPLIAVEKMLREFQRWPKFQNAYYLAFKHMLEGRTYDKWKTAADVMDWYIYGRPKKTKSGVIYYEGDYYDERPHMFDDDRLDKELWRIYHG